MHEGLRSRLCAELEKIENKSSFGMAELEIMNKLTDTIKNIDKINKLNANSYSDWEAVGYYSKAIDEMNTSKDDLTDNIRNMLNSHAVGYEDRNILEKAMHILTK